MLKFLLFSLFVLMPAGSVLSQPPNREPRRLTALERMDAHDKRTAKQAQQGGSMVPGGNQIYWHFQPNRSNLNKAVKKIIGGLVKSEADVSRYLNGLASESIRLLRLVPYSGCTNDKDQVKPGVPVCGTDADIGGGGSSFSFRTNQYSPLVYSDIVVENSEMFAYGTYSTTFFMDLGDVAFESIGIDHPAVVQAKCIKPVSTRLDYDRLTLSDRISVTACETEFRSYVPVNIGHTYISRSIAYKAGNPSVYSPIMLNWGTAGDKREDSLVVFKVLAREKDGSLTLVWKQLSKTEAPKLK